MDIDPVIWLIIGVALMVAEIFVPAFVIFFFGIGALVTALVSWLLPGSNFLLEVGVWLATSVASLGLFRRFFAPWFKGRELKSEQQAIEHSGQTAEVLKSIGPDKPGRIKFQGTTWKAIAFDENLRKGDKVEILKKEDLTYVVTKSREKRKLK